MTCTVVTGPLMAEPDAERLRAIGKRVGARVHRFADDFRGKLARASAVVAMGGYNTVCDVLSFRRPAVIIPRPGPSREQPLRAKILSDRGLASSVPLSACTADRLAEAVAGELARSGYPEEAIPPLDGVDRAVDRLLDLMG